MLDGVELCKKSALQCVLFNVLCLTWEWNQIAKFIKMHLFGSIKRKDCEELYQDVMKLNVQYQKSNINECKMTHIDQ